MKSKYFLGMILGLVLLTFGLLSYTNSETETDDSVLINQPNTYNYQFTKDTITNTEIDTLTLSTKLLSKWQAVAAVDVTNISGSTILGIRVDESTSLTGGW